MLQLLTSRAVPKSVKYEPYHGLARNRVRAVGGLGKCYRAFGENRRFRSDARAHASQSVRRTSLAVAGGERRALVAAGRPKSTISHGWPGGAATAAP
jgi:hypothetical protein